MKKIFFFLFIGLAVTNPLFAAEKIKIVATTSTLAAIARSVAGDKANVESIAAPNRDLHFITPTPKDIMKLKKAAVFVHGGLDLEVWRGPLLDAVGRTELMTPAGERQIDVSAGISLLEIPESLSRAHGDIHAFGNPHYWLDPVNGKIIAQNIAEGLSKLYPTDADFFQKNLQVFQTKMDEKLRQWETELAPYKGAGIVVYHNSWPYFLGRFGFETLGYLEPKPGIPPAPKHIAELIQAIKAKNGKIIVKEIFHENRSPKKIAGETGAAIVVLFTEPGEISPSAGYFALFDENIRRLKEGLK